MSAISSLASALGISETAEPVTMGLQEFDLTKASEVDGTLRAFQYFPETITDSKSPDWSRKPVPGGSHPIVSFIHGGERQISFSAIFTQEKNPESQGLLSSLLTGSFSIGLKSATKHSLPPGTGGISAALAWLRGYTCPDYLDNGTAKPPPAAVIYLPNSGIIGAGGHVDSLVGVMTECNVVYETFHRNGAPRIAVVSLSFIEIAQISFQWQFFGRGNFAAASAAYPLQMQAGTRDEDAVYNGVSAENAG